MPWQTADNSLLQNNYNTKTMTNKIPDNFKLKFQPGQLRRNLPILMKTDCSSAAGIFSMDGKIKYENLEFIPLRLDYSRDAYEGKKVGLLLGVTIEGNTRQESPDGKIVTNKLPQGMSFYMVLKPSRTMRGGLDNYTAMATMIEQVTEQRACSMIWRAGFEIQSGSTVVSGEVVPMKYARINWFVRPYDGDIELNILNQLSEEFQTSDLFEGICPANNPIISQFDEMAKQGEIARLEQNNELAALPEAPDF